MIDPVWLRNIIAMAEADTGAHDAARLAVLLGEPAEVLPYLVTRAGGFADWPKARAAIANARSRAPRGQPGQTQPSLPDRSRPARSPSRADLFDALRHDLLANAVHRQAESGPAPERLTGLIRRVRFDEALGADSPSMFITEA